MREPLAGEPASGPGFLLPFGHRRSLLGVFLRPLGNWAFLTVGLPAGEPPDPIGVVTFRMR
jgi:hypothetical protein